jgi:hypothetical protein
MSAMYTRGQASATRKRLHNPHYHTPESSHIKRVKKITKNHAKQSKKPSRSLSLPLPNPSSPSLLNQPIPPFTQMAHDIDDHVDFVDNGAHVDDIHDSAYDPRTDHDDPDALLNASPSIFDRPARANDRLIRENQLHEQLQQLEQQRRDDPNVLSDINHPLHSTFDDLLKHNSLYRKIPPAFRLLFLSACRDYWSELSTAIHSMNETDIHRSLLSVLLLPARVCRRTRGGQYKRKSKKHDAMNRNFESVFKELAAMRAARMNANLLLPSVEIAPVNSLPDSDSPF